MAKAATQEATERRLKGDFKGVTLIRAENGDLTVKISDLSGSQITFDVADLNGVDATIIASGGAKIVKQVRVEKQDNVLETTQSSVDAKAYSIGDTLPDGWVVGGTSPTTGKIFSVEPVAGALDRYQTWHTGEDRAKTLLAEGHENARQPDMAELNVLYNDVVRADRNQNAQLNTRGSSPFGIYWSSEAHPANPDIARVQYFGDGCCRGASYKDNAIARVRCVRDEPGLTLA